MNIVLFRTVVFEISSFVGSTVLLGLSKDKRYLIVIYGNPESEFKVFEPRLYRKRVETVFKKCRLRPCHFTLPYLLTNVFKLRKHFFFLWNIKILILEPQMLRNDDLNYRGQFLPSQNVMHYVSSTIFVPDPIPDYTGINWLYFHISLK